MQVFTAQQAANVQLQLQIQQNQAVQIDYTNTLISLAESTQQRNFDHIFASIPIYNRTNKEGVSNCIERLEATCLQRGRDIHTEVLCKLGGNVRNYLIGLP